MAFTGGKKNSPKSRSTSPNDDNYHQKGAKIILPETSIPTFAARVPELKKITSHWQIGTATLSRVKINSLRSDAIIRTDRSTTINGMFSEFYAPIETLGTTIVHIFDLPVELHVTRSKQCAPIVADGILGCDFLAEYSFSLTLGNRGHLLLQGHDDPITLLPGKDLIDDYTNLVRRKVVEESVARERGPWSIVSKRLLKLRDALPVAAAQDERLGVIETLEEYVDCFHLPGEKLGFTHLLTYSIRSKDIVVKEQPKLSDENWRNIERQINHLLDQEIIRPSSSSYNHPVGIIEKKPNSRGKVNHRLAVDFRELNNRSQSDVFLIPDIIDLVDQLHGAKFFTVLDLASASYQIPLNPKHCHKTAFTTPNGRYEFQRMPGGIKNASQYLQRLLHQVLDGMIYPSVVFVCHDDILIHAATLAEHEIRVRKVLARLREAGLKVQPDKCQLFRNSVMYLGYRITDEGLRPDIAKIDKLRAQPLPKTTHELSSYLGLLSSFRRFIPNYAARSKAMGNLLKNEKLEWTKEAKMSFEDLKKCLDDDWLLQYPDWNREFILETSSSNLGVQAVLAQKKSCNARALPIAYASRCYTASEARDDRFNRERLAALYGMETWYWYFSETDGCKFTLRTAVPEAFEWYRLRQRHDSDLLTRFEIAFSGKNFIIEPLSDV